MANISNITRSEQEPHSDLTAIANDLGERVPEGVRAIILLDVLDPDGHGGSAGAGFIGYEDDDDILEAWRRHLSAFQMARVGS